MSAEILLVEDRESLRAMLAETLTGEGYTVEPVATGEEAVRRLTEGRRYGLVLTDLKLPGADGIVVLKAAIASDPAVPVVVLTGFGTVETAVVAMKAGAADFLSKPVDPDLLLLLVERHVRARRSAVARVLLAEEAGLAGMPEIVGILACAGRGARTGAPGGAVRRHGPPDRGVGHGQGALRARAPCALAARAGPLRRRERRGPAREPRRERALRPRARRLHGRHGPPCRPLRAGGRRDALSRRDRRAPGRGAGEAPARRRGADVPARRRDRADHRRRPPRRRDEPRSRAAREVRRLPRGPLLPSRRLPRAAPAAALASRGHSRAREEPSPPPRRGRSRGRRSRSPRELSSGSRRTTGPGTSASSAT